MGRAESRGGEGRDDGAVPTASATFAHENSLLARSLVRASISLSSSSRVQSRLRRFGAGCSAGTDASGPAGSGEAVAGALLRFRAGGAATARAGPSAPVASAALARSASISRT